MALKDELKIWINGDPRREALLRKEAPIGESTLQSTLRGRYNPGPLLERRLRDVMEKHPGSPEAKTATG